MGKTHSSPALLTVLEPRQPGDVHLSQHAEMPQMPPFLTILSYFFSSPLKSRPDAFC